jgi:Na+/H+ antiporter NhaD/arsenite permease-like protein
LVVLLLVLANDVVVVAMVPLIMQLTLARRLNPVPFLLGFCFAANAGSAGTIIGSPQNMIIAQGMNLSFTGFMKAAAIPSILSLLPIWGVLCLIYRRRWDVPASGGTAPAGVAPVPLNVLETAKATVVTVLVIAAFMLTSWPRELIALGAGAVLLVNRKIASADMLKHVDGNLFILLGGLFVVNAALATTGLPQRVLAELQGLGLDLQNPLALFLMIGVLSDIVGNNPAALLVVPYVQADNGELAGAAMALGTGFASNIIVFGSLAGIIVVQSAEQHGLSISLAEYSRAGIPVTLLSMLIGAGWLLFLA